MLHNVGLQLAAIQLMLQDALDGIGEIKDGIDWFTLIAMVSEHQVRIKYAIETALEIPVTVGETTTDPAGEDSTVVQVDEIELQEWARKTVDLANGLPYHLYGLHQALVGETLLGKPLMEVYFKVLSHYMTGDVPFTVPRYYAQFVALQVQGFGVLDKARSLLSMKPVNYTDTLRLRVNQQISFIAFHFANVFGVTEWHDDMVPDSSAGQHVCGGGDQKTPPDFDFMYMVNAETDVVCDIWNEGPKTFVKYGQPSPDTLQIADAKTEQISLPDDVPLFDRFPSGYTERYSSETYGPYFYCDIRELAIDSKYAIVGFKFSCKSTTNTIEPILADFDREKCTTSWPGYSYSGATKPSTTYRATLPPVEPETGPSILRMTDPTVAKNTPIEGPVKMLRGVKLSIKGEDCFGFGRPDPNWSSETWLPSGVALNADLIYQATRISRDIPHIATDI